MRRIAMLDAADADRLIALAEAAAARMQVPQNIAVVDAAGALLAFRRMDGARPYTVEFAIAKARTAAGLHAPTASLAAIALPGERGFGLNTLNGGEVAVLGGGMPVTFEGAVAGAIGVSSGTVHQDAEVAHDAVTAFEEDIARAAGRPA